MQKYYTKSNIAELCSINVKKYINIDYNNDLIIEPSAGNGVFIPFLKKLCKNTLFIDIKPEHKDIIKHNYLTLNPIRTYNKIHVVGNPPFGFKGSMAIRFIKKASQYCDTISFILPLSFAKNSMQHSIPLHYHLKYSNILPNNSFVYKGSGVDIPCIFQIWEKRNNNRKEVNKVSPLKYKFINYPKDADVAIRRVGSLAGKIYYDLLNKNTNSHYFIKLNDKNDINKLRDIKIKNKYYVSGACSISKQDIIRKINKMLE